MKPFFVYVLRCSDGSYYTGHTDELELRVVKHQTGEIEGYTQDRRPVALVWSQETATREEALAAEMQIKGWSRSKKEALIAGDWARVSALAKSREGLPSTTSGRSDRRVQPERPVPVRPEPVEGQQRAQQGLRQAQPERDSPVCPELVEGFVPRERVLRQAQDERDGLAERVLQHDRRALAKAITLIESTRADHRAQADALLNTLLPHTGQSLRLGISGVPGVGKSTFIETLGLHLITQGHRVAVLAVDPSSTLSGGSILGDKTRMEKLSVNDAAFIRPTPTSGALGGVAEHTREALLLCEAAGFDVVIVETVGVGQSETAVAGMTDLFVLLQLPNAGDDLQAIKRGVMERADLVLINKADLDAAAATRAMANISGVPVMLASALTGEGIDAVWSAVQAQTLRRRADGAFEKRRRDQALAWMWDIIGAGLTADFKRHTAVRAAMPALQDDVVHARIAPSAAARALLQLFEKN
jgi:LAO/AO transport system kinase